MLTRCERGTRHAHGPESHDPPAGGDRASSYLIGFIVAGALFSVAMAFTIQHVLDATASGPDVEAEVASDARQALKLTVEDPGFTTDGRTAWNEDPDDLERFGLTTGERSNVLDFDKLQALRDGQLEADGTNDAPDYPEVRKALGLEEDAHFHLRTVPLFVTLDDSTYGPNPSMEAAYVAEGEGGSSNTGSTSSASTSDNGDQVTFEVTVENTGDQDMVYKVTFELETDDGLIAVDDQYTPLLSPGGTTTLSVTTYEVDGWDGTTGHMNATLYDAWGNEHDAVDFDAVDLPHDGDGSSDVEHNFIVDPAGFSFGPGEDLTLYLDHYDHTGDRIKEQGDGPDARIAVVDPGGTEVVNESVTLPHNKALEWTCDAACDTEGDYQAVLMTPDATRLAVDNFRNASTEEFTQSKTPTGDAEYEMGLMEDLVASFENQTHDPADHAGDVYVDDRDVLADQLVEHLSGYDVLVIGSNVDHDEMTSGGVKWPIHDWVTEEGGHLVVLGNEDVNTQWLQPLHGAGTTSASGGVSDPDPTHPILHSPEELNYETYDDHDRAWMIRANNDEYYTHVLVKESTESGSDDTLAASKPGAFGNGSVVLSAYLLHDLFDGDHDEESQKFLRNMLAQSYQTVFVDYGPAIPDDGIVASETRLAVVPHESLPGGQVELKVIKYVWK